MNFEEIEKDRVSKNITKRKETPKKIYYKKAYV